MYSESNQSFVTESGGHAVVVVHVVVVEVATIVHGQRVIAIIAMGGPEPVVVGGTGTLARY